MKMGKKDVIEEKLLRFAAPNLYQKMVDVFSSYNIHSYDIYATVVKQEKGYDLTLRFSQSFSQSVTALVTFEQAKNPDEEITDFLKETAEKCKNQLISDYYKMIKL
ncbi:hypothetical protein RGU12_10675 [Fredinandcohnia sp. QZ13]|uniref:hypothetical protein n=1 Tax=Fredinandcohnia sp. QZ13 TaxID=3073144 RepID=UPI0028530083|nr:hypothetical protein [Fredinandcohnia sp. QZ13]MDR4888011.1 hypothetical protein [Fredinandcohnia sp. QZ13]